MSKTKMTLNFMKYIKSALLYPTSAKQYFDDISDSIVNMNISSCYIESGSDFEIKLSDSNQVLTNATYGDYNLAGNLEMLTATKTIISNQNESVTFQQTITNETGTTKTFKQIGLFWIGINSRRFLIANKILDADLVIEPNQTKTISFVINLSNN